MARAHFLLSDGNRILLARGLRAFGDGFVALLIPIYLDELGFSAAGDRHHRYRHAAGDGPPHALGRDRRQSLLAALAVARRRRVDDGHGAGFATTTAFWPLLVIAFIGTMNPTSGDASVFLPLEQAALAQIAEPRRRTAMFARYSLIGSLAGALGALAAAAPDLATAGHMRHSACGHAADVHRLRRARSTRSIALSSLVTGDRGQRSGNPHAARLLEAARIRPCRPIRHGLVRDGVSRAIVAGFVAVPAISNLGLGGGGDPVLERHLLGRVVPDRSADRRADRSDQHDGVYPPAVQHSAGIGAVRTRPDHRRRAAAGAQRACPKWTCRPAALM